MIFSKGKQINENEAQRARSLMERRWNPYIRKFTKLAKQALTEQAEQAISTIQKNGISAGIEETATLQINSIPIQLLIDKIYKEVGKSFFDYVRKKNEARKKEEVEVLFFQQLANYVLQTRATKVKEITETTRNEIKKVIADGVLNGLGVEEIARSIRKLVAQTYPNRALTIARTETIGAANFGSQKGAESLGLDLKKIWVAQIDGRERQSHREVNMTAVGLSDTFEVGGQRLLYPHDLAGDAKNVINCRCAVIYQEA